MVDLSNNAYMRVLLIRYREFSSLLDMSIGELLYENDKLKEENIKLEKKVEKLLYANANLTDKKPTKVSNNG